MEFSLSNEITPLTIFVLAFCLSASAGLAALLRLGKTVTWMSTLSSLLYSGMSGLMIAMIWYKQMKDDGVYMLLGGCIAAGLTGAKVSDFVLSLFAGKFRFKIIQEPDSLTPGDK